MVWEDVCTRFSVAHLSRQFSLDQPRASGVVVHGVWSGVAAAGPLTRMLDPEHEAQGSLVVGTLRPSDGDPWFHMNP
jgi:hypothetical protein